MITEQQVLALFSEANPVPIAEDAPPLDLTVLESAPVPPAMASLPSSALRDDRPGGLTRRRRLAAVAAGAVLAIAVAVPLVMRAEDGIAGAVDVVRSYFSARDRWDGATLEQVFSEDAMILEDPRGGVPLPVSDIVALTEFERALEWRWTLGECDAEPGGGAGTYSISCSYTSENAWTTVLDRPPLAADMLFTVEDGRITRMEHDFPYGQYESLWATFQLWLGEAHPDISDRIVGEAANGQERPLLTDEAIALWQEYSPLFVASIGAQALPEHLAIAEHYFMARGRWDGATVRSLFAPDAEISVDGSSSLPTKDLEAFTEWERALQWTWTIDECRSGPPGGADVICTSSSENLWTRALRRPPITFETQLDIDDRRITRLDSDFMAYQLGDLWYGFFGWLDDTHPGIGEQLLDEAAFPRLDDAAIALWEDFGQQYAAVLGADLAIARAYFDGRDQWDSAGLTELFSREAVIVLDGSTELPVAGVGGLSEFERALDWRWSIGECQSGWANGANLTCAYSADNAWTRALGRSPISAEITFTIAGGRIVRLVPALPHEEFGYVWDEFTSWLDENLPGARSRLIQTANGIEIPRLDAEAISLWQEYAPMFVAAVDEGT